MGAFASLEGVFAQEGHTFRNAAVVISAIWALKFFWTFYQTRKFYRNLPGPPHSWFLGHLPALVRASARFPPDVHPQLILNSLVDEYSLREPGVMYVDTYPVRTDNQMVITRGSLASQVSVHHSMRKHPLLLGIFGRVVGMKAMSMVDGPLWKEFRNVFNAGFAAGNIMALMPAMLDEGEVFVQRLRELAAAGGPKGGYTPSIMVMLKDLSADIIIRLTIGESSHCQVQPNELIDLICTSSKLPQPTSINPLDRLDVVTPLKLRYYEWRCKRIIKKIVEKRWRQIWTGEAKEPDRKAAKTMLDIALFKYHANALNGWTPAEKMEPEFLDIMCDNVKGFVFGGQDTTANSTSWALYNISKHPEVLARLRREHDSVFGTDPDAISDVLRSSPHLLNELPYTTAVIKESMRVFAPASSIRESDDHMTLRDPVTGRILPTKNQLIFMPSQILQRDTVQYPHPHDFIPSRFMPSDDEGNQDDWGVLPKIDSDNYRPFEKGPRGCIGQDFAMTEMKLILSLVSRRLSFENGYEELNLQRGTKMATVEGEGGPAYPVLFTTAQPKDGMPMWVRSEIRKEKQ